MNAPNEDDENLDFGLGNFDLDLDGFDGDEIGEMDNRYVAPRLQRRPRQSQVIYEHAEKMVQALGQHIAAGERVDALVSGNFIFGDFIEALAVMSGSRFDDLTMSTLAISRDNVDSLQNLMAGDYLGTLNIIVSDYFWSHNRINAPYIFKALDVGDRFQLAVAGTHTKIALIKTELGRKIVIHGSANFRSSRSVETFTVETNPELYDFHKKWHDEILAAHATIKKAIRGGALFDVVTKNAKGAIWS